VRVRTVTTLLASAALALGAVVASATTAAAAGGPTPQEYIDRGGEIKICTRGTLFDGMINFGCRPPPYVGPETTWNDLRAEEDAVSPMLCRPSLVNHAFDRTEVMAAGAGAAVQCTPVPGSWYE
jgi:hypothetical protein